MIVGEKQIINTMNPNTFKAVSATVKIGATVLDCLQFPDGSYHFYVSQLKENLQIYSDNSTGKKYIQPLLDANPKQVNSAKIGSSKSHVKTYSLDIVSQAIGIYAELGNQTCIKIAIGCVAESLERRADAAFGKQRMEIERNDRFVARVEGKIVRRGLTDAIKDYLSIQTGLTLDYRAYIYINCSDYLNVVVLGCRSKSAKEFYQLADRDALRDRVPAKALRELETAENLATRLIDDGGYEPLAAVKRACDIGFIKSIGLD